MMGSRTEEYLEAVLSELPPRWPMREEVVGDLRAHLAEAVESGATEEEAMARLGTPGEVAAAMLEDYHPSIAPLGRRTAAFLIDAGLGWATVLVVAGTAVLVAGGSELVPWVLFMAWLVAAGVLSLLYFPVFEALYGQTPGKRMLGLLVITEDGHAVGWKGAILRRLPLVFEFFLPDALFAPFTEKKQRAFDLVAKTIVVRTEQRLSNGPAALLGLALWLLPLLYVAVVNNRIGF